MTPAPLTVSSVRILHPRVGEGNAGRRTGFLRANPIWLLCKPLFPLSSGRLLRHAWLG